MSEVTFGLTMKDAWKQFLKGKDSTIYRQFENSEDYKLDELKDRLYKYNYRLFIFLVFVGLFFSIAFKILFFSMLWYKPLCRALHLNNRVKRLNIELFKSAKGLQ